jgi:sigma-B regulation protein RsbU (phosphoserine phosphatase)
MKPRDLSTIPLFSSLPAEEISRLSETLTYIEFSADKVLFQEGHSDDKFYILLDGKVEVIKSLGLEGERIMGVRDAGTFLGEMSLFSKDGVHTASVRSVTSLCLLRITREELNELLHRQPHLAYELIRLLSERLEETENLTILDLKEKNKRLILAYEELKNAQKQIIEKERLEKELEISGQIQQSILPVDLPIGTGYDFGALMIPARYVGGDFYTWFNLGRDRIGIVVGDVSDKGVPAAIFMGLTYSLIRAESYRTRSPENVLYNVNHHLLQMNSSGMFVTLVYGILDLKSGDFNFARAGHPTPFLLDESGKFVDIPVSPGPALGLFEGEPIEEQTIHLAPGGVLLLYSDGVNENLNARGDEFGIKMLTESMQCNRHLPAQDICKQLWKDVQAHGGNEPQQDDFTTVVVKRSKAG